MGIEIVGPVLSATAETALASLALSSDMPNFPTTASAYDRVNNVSDASAAPVGRRGRPEA
jgi:hypothetical protein